MKTSTKMLFSTTIIMSTILVISSTSWINMWIGLEINLMSFIPLISESKNILLSQSTMMYFLTQSMASMMFIVFILLNKYMFITVNKSMIMMFITMSMMMKMGMPPFHMWFPQMMEKMNWMMCFILMTWQKIAPMYIMSMVIQMNKITIMAVCLSAVMGAIGGLNNTSTRKIMAYSSMTHMSWMVACSAVYKKSWMVYMMLYTMIMLILTVMMHTYNIMFINQMNIYSKSTNKFIFMSMMLSIGGLPPFIGFMPKWIAIQYILSSKEIIMLTILMMSALITLSYYLRISSSMNLILSSSQKWMSMSSIKGNISMYIFYLNLMLPMFILLMNFY